MSDNRYSRFQQSSTSLRDVFRRGAAGYFVSYGIGFVGGLVLVVFVWRSRRVGENSVNA